MTNDFLIPIGKRISEVRRSHKVTQEALADKLGVSPKHISHTECGTSSLSLKNLIEFCNLFGCSLDYIIFGTVKDSGLSKLPDEISSILYTGTEQEVDRLNRYLQMYVELTKSQTDPDFMDLSGPISLCATAYGSFSPHIALFCFLLAAHIFPQFALIFIKALP